MIDTGPKQKITAFKSDSGIEKIRLEEARKIKSFMNFTKCYLFQKRLSISKYIGENRPLYFDNNEE